MWLKFPTKLCENFNFHYSQSLTNCNRFTMLNVISIHEAAKQKGAEVLNLQILYCWGFLIIHSSHNMHVFEHSSVLSNCDGEQWIYSIARVTSQYTNISVVDWTVIIIGDKPDMLSLPVCEGASLISMSKLLPFLKMSL